MEKCQLVAKTRIVLFTTHTGMIRISGCCYITEIRLKWCLTQHSNMISFLYHRHISGPHICGDAIDIDPRHNHILTGSWCTGVTLQVRSWELVLPTPLQGSMSKIVIMSGCLCSVCLFANMAGAPVISGLFKVLLEKCSRDCTQNLFKKRIIPFWLYTFTAICRSAIFVWKVRYLYS